jgi:hypothetical protein
MRRCAIRVERVDDVRRAVLAPRETRDRQRSRRTILHGGERTSRRSFVSVKLRRDPEDLLEASSSAT